MIPGTPEHEIDNEIENNLNERKIRISVKGDTVEYRKLRKFKRNSGQEYTTNKGKIVKGRSSEPLLNCRAKCNTKIGNELRETLFASYWSMNNFNRRVAYISSCISFTDTKTTRKRRNTPEKQKNRNKTFHYVVPKDGNSIPVCKSCFLKIFGETKKFVSNVCAQKLSSPINKTSPDKRGKASPPNKITSDDIALVKQHLNRLPTYESHYCRKETRKKYLPPYFTLRAAYNEYVKTVETPVSRTIYEKYFRTSGLKVKSPKKDTCAQCDRLHMQISDSHCSLNKKNELIAEQKKHQEEAEEAYCVKRKDSSASTSTEKTCVLAFDLQQCLPTPCLESSVIFYKRQLWTYNLTVHNMKTSTASCYIWSEPIAKRGANDIGSCVFDFLKELSPDIKHVIMYSDCCSGQNKNSILIAMCLWFLENQESINVIDHKFLVPGHTRMECDSDHAKIEKARKRYSAPINHPNNWTEIIRWAGKNKFNVKDMNQNDFYDFNNLLKTKYKMSKTNTIGEKFAFRHVKWLRYVKEEKNIVSYKTTLKEDDEFLKLDLSRKKVSFNNLLNAYNEELPITNEKKKDLITLLPLIPEVFHQYYINLKTKTVTDPIISDEEDIDF